MKIYANDEDHYSYLNLGKNNTNYWQMFYNVRQQSLGWWLKGKENNAMTLNREGDLSIGHTGIGTAVSKVTLLGNNAF